MKRLIDAIIAKWFTVPEWELVASVHYRFSSTDPEPYKVKKLYQCKKTGKFKIINL